MRLIKNGWLCDPKSGMEGEYDILIDGDHIEKIQKNINERYIKEDLEVYDAQGLVIAPGLVDVHVHFRDPGFTHKEDIFTGARSAARGGFTTVVLMANTRPTVDNVETLKYVSDKGAQTDINIYTCGNVTLGMKGEVLTDMELLAANGAVGFTDDGIPLMDESIVTEAMKRAKALNMPISFHEENPALITNNGVNRGRASEYYGIGGSPREAEISLVKRDLELADETGAIINIQHISARESVDLVRAYRNKNKNIHAEATPHHFTLTEDAVIKYGTMAKMNPPLREEADRKAVIQGLADGTIDIIATDHAPHSMDEKSKPITDAPSGIIGLETALALGITTLVDAGYLDMKTFLSKLTCNPAEMYHLNAGYIAEGGPADLVLIDKNKKWTVKEFASRSANTPFVGWELTGAVKVTICGGKTVYEAED